MCFGAKLGAEGLGAECVGPKIKFVAQDVIYNFD